MYLYMNKCRMRSKERVPKRYKSQHKLDTYLNDFLLNLKIILL